MLRSPSEAAKILLERPGLDIFLITLDDLATEEVHKFMEEICQGGKNRYWL